MNEQKSNLEPPKREKVAFFVANSQQDFSQPIWEDYRVVIFKVFNVERVQKFESGEGYVEIRNLSQEKAGEILDFFRTIYIEDVENKKV